MKKDVITLRILDMLVCRYAYEKTAEELIQDVKLIQKELFPRNPPVQSDYPEDIPF